FDRLGTAGHALPGAGARGGGQCRGVGRKRFGKYAADRVGPAAVMLNDFVGDMTHGKLAVAGAGDGGRGEHHAHSMPKSGAMQEFAVGWTKGRAGQRRQKMCRNIKTLFNFEPPATE